MKLLNCTKMRIVFVGVVAVMVIGGGSTKADFTFGEITNLSPTVIDKSGQKRGASLSADGLTLFFSSVIYKDKWDYDLYMVTRETLDDDWGPTVSLGPIVNSPAYEDGPSISTDGLELYFASGRENGHGRWDLWVAKRETIDDDWGTPLNLGPAVNGTAKDDFPCISGDGLSLYFASDRPGGLGDWDTWVTQRPTKDDPWEEPVNLGPTINSPYLDRAPVITSDGLTLIFSSSRVGTHGQYADLWATTRKTTDDPWREPFNLGPVINTDDVDWASISPDGTTLFLSCFGRVGIYGYSIWQTPIIPIVDFNGDGTVDAGDVRIMIDHWGTDNSLCDIGPTPFGDGFVDIKDLIALAEYIGKDVDDPTLVAHWALDEIEGMVVTDSAGDNDGYALGEPVWQPDGGMVGGALQFDGVDDFISVPAVLNPSAGPFSLVAWIKGGAPGQVVVSQIGKANWLGADPSEGTLMTELTVAGRNSSSLGSEAIITDGNWHRIGFVWDGSYRRLYVDGLMVAEDAHDNLDISVNGLYFGTGKTMEPGTFFSGLIDEVRIYNRAVMP